MIKTTQAILLVALFVLTTGFRGGGGFEGGRGGAGFDRGAHPQRYEDARAYERGYNRGVYGGGYYGDGGYYGNGYYNTDPYLPQTQQPDPLEPSTFQELDMF